MDRKGKQKIRYILFFSVFLTVLIVFLCIFYHMEKLRKQQLQELMIIYPEIQGELQDNFLFYQNQMLSLKLTMGAAVIILFILWGCSFALVTNKKRKNAFIEYEREIDFIYEQLVRFQKGDFEIIPALTETDVSDKLSGVHEKLLELGHFFSDLKTHLAAEENNTKALITNISHQIKTPLASVRMCHDLVKASDLSDEEREKLLETESQELTKMEQLLEELVKLSRLENNMIQIIPERNSLKQTLREAVSQVFVKAHAKNIEICVEMKGDVTILHDRKWTIEALGNILENAVKYSEPLTTINIRVSDLPSNILLEIEDEGIGIPENEFHEIFKRFYRGSNARLMAKDGAGIGLYLARYIIEQQGGSIIAKKRFEKGTVFKIILPS